MASLNKAILIGNLGKDPEIRTMENGKIVASFSLATTESYKNKAGEKVTNTEWHNITMWSPLAEIAQKYLKKGSSVYVEGKISTRKWEDKEKVTRYSTDIKVNELVMLSKASGDSSDAPAPAGSVESILPPEINAPMPTAEPAIPMPTATDDLPF
jgi:single-strand DNA-binding protein